MSRVPENKRARAYGKRSRAYGTRSPAHGAQSHGGGSPAHSAGSAYETEAAGRFNKQYIHAFVVIAFIAVFILGLMIKITFF